MIVMRDERLRTPAQPRVYETGAARGSCGLWVLAVGNRCWCMDYDQRTVRMQGVNDRDIACASACVCRLGDI